MTSSTDLHLDTDPEFDRKPGLGPSLLRAMWPFGGSLLWAAHLSSSYIAVEMLCRNHPDLKLLGMRADAVVVFALTILTGVPTALLALGSRRRATSSDDSTTPLRSFGASFSIWLNIIMLFAILLEGAVVLFVARCPT